MFLGNSAWALPRDNPFELLPRLPEPISEEMGNTPFSPAPEIPHPADLNPFELYRNWHPTERAPDIFTLPNLNSTTIISSGPPVATTERFKNFMTGTLLFGAVLFGALLLLFRDVPAKVWESFKSQNLLHLHYRDTVHPVVSGYSLLYINTIVQIAIFGTLLLYRGQYLQTDRIGISLLILIVLTAVLLLTKHVMVFVLTQTFSAGVPGRLYNFTLLIYGIVLGWLLLPLNFCLLFVSTLLFMVLVYAAILFIALLYAYRYLRLLGLAQRLLYVFPFHFLLYICAVEILPALLLLRTFSRLF